MAAIAGGPKAYVCGTCDTKGDELVYVRDLIRAAGVPTALVDLGTRSDGRLADVTPA
ncbi:MAG TPA: Tm-1-like ATP-binding domain-containing protein, partial [Geminicoccaceae bacterium]|nr:Tm-1-like ATP-binding domain-containing protein [Geminicoccaceae bacterium]